MLRFSLRKTPAKEHPKREATTEEEVVADGGKETAVRVNYTSRAWLASLRKRTLSVESLSNMFSGVGRQDTNRRESLNSGGGSLTGGSNSKLMRTHKMQTKSGEPVEIYFGYDALSINGRSIGYGDVVFWSHSASHFTMTYLSKTSGRRKDIVLYPTEKGPKPSDLTDMLGVRIARLVADQTGCSEEKAMRMATAKANETELREAVQALEQHQHEESLLGEKSGAVLPSKKVSHDDRGLPFRANSGMIERMGSGMIEMDTKAMTFVKTTSNPSLDKERSLGDESDGVILEGEEPQPTPV